VIFILALAPRGVSKGDGAPAPHVGGGYYAGERRCRGKPVRRQLEPAADGFVDAADSGQRGLREQCWRVVTRSGVLRCGLAYELTFETVRCRHGFS
jgi:hypothetical protein